MIQINSDERFIIVNNPEHTKLKLVIKVMKRKLRDPSHFGFEQRG